MMAVMKVREMIRLLEERGWHLDRIKGSHRQFRHSELRGTVTVPGKPSEDLGPEMVASIFSQAGIKGKEKK
jgi:predicted RNA binding protein YcfA (HicA-like mRNA interferase family)